MGVLVVSFVFPLSFSESIMSKVTFVVSQESVFSKRQASSRSGRYHGHAQ